MVKGHTYSEQLFEDKAFRHFMNVFLDGNTGITKGCNITKDSNTIKIEPGFFIIKGGLLEEDIGTPNIIPTEAGFYKLVYEINLSKINTEQEFNQGSYKFIRGVGEFPNLIQNDLENEEGIYQFPFCQFIVTETGVTEFKDLRIFLNFDSIYEEIRELIESITDESFYASKDDLKKTRSSLSITHSGEPWVVQEANKRVIIPFNKVKIDNSNNYLTEEGSYIKIGKNVKIVNATAYISLKPESPTTGNANLIIARKRGEMITEYAAINSFHVLNEGGTDMVIPFCKIDVQEGDLIGAYFMASNSGNFIVNARNIYSALEVEIVE